jgi:hypothetical protein
MEVRGFFVHPATGLLCYNQEKRWRVHPTKKFMDRLSKFGFFDIDRSRGFRFESPLHVGQAQRFRIVDELTVLELKPGGWFIHIYVYHNPEEIIEWRECTVGQAQLPGRIPVLRKEKKDWPTRYCLSTRQMGKKEIKKHLAIIARDPI